VSGRAYAPSAAMEVARAPRKGEGETRVFMDAAPKARMKTGAVLEEKRAAGLAPRDIAALKDDTAPSPSYMDETLSKVKNVVELAGGKVVSAERAKESGQPPSIHAEISAERYNAFCEELKKLGNFQSTPPALPETDQEVVRVHIRLISAR